MALTHPQLAVTRPPAPEPTAPSTSLVEAVFHRPSRNGDKRSGGQGNGPADTDPDGSSEAGFADAGASLGSMLAALDLDQACGDPGTPGATPTEPEPGATLDDLLRRAAA